jgi:hypothetical protein
MEITADTELKWEDFATHDEFARAQSQQLWLVMQRAAKETGQSVQAVSNRMIYGMYNEAKRLKALREAGLS